MLWIGEQKKAAIENGSSQLLAWRSVAEVATPAVGLLDADCSTRRFLTWRRGRLSSSISFY
jgi:hypothetical protein